MRYTAKYFKPEDVADIEHLAKLKISVQPHVTPLVLPMRSPRKSSKASPTSKSNSPRHSSKLKTDKSPKSERSNKQKASTPRTKTQSAAPAASLRKTSSRVKIEQLGEYASYIIPYCYSLAEALGIQDNDKPDARKTAAQIDLSQLGEYVSSL